MSHLIDYIWEEESDIAQQYKFFTQFDQIFFNLPKKFQYFYLKNDNDNKPIVCNLDFEN